MKAVRFHPNLGFRALSEKYWGAGVKPLVGSETPHLLGFSVSSVNPPEEGVTLEEVTHP
jgi:hypothetical protein